VTARLFPLALAIGLVLPAQDSPPRSKASDYPAHVQLPRFELGAEYLVHNIPAEKGEYWAKEYLVVELAVFPSTREGVRISANQFVLRINGKKTVLLSDSPGTVAAALKYPDWEARPNLTASAGIGDAGVVLGAPPATARFPGDNRGVATRPIPKDPGDQDTYGLRQDTGPPIEQAIAVAALPEGQVDRPVKGCLFFRFSGKIKSIRSLDLIYDPGDGAKAAIPLVQ
jgi:hypothetical protein